MAELEPGAFGIPDFGPVILRTHILGAAKPRGASLTVVCAPAGYGKSVVAAQLAAALSVDASVWIPLHNSDLSGDEWLNRVADVLLPDCPRTMGVSDVLPQLGSAPASGNATLRIRDALRPFKGRTVDLLLDGANRVQSLQPLVDLAQLLRKSTSESSRVILTCRTLLCDDDIPDPMMVWVIGAHELRFDETEVRELAACSLNDESDEVRVKHLIERFCGHPALTSLMVRHARIDDATEPPQDLIWYTRRLVEQLDREALPSAYVAALLREGAVSEIHDCLCSAGIGNADESALQNLMPLLKFSDSPSVVGTSFRLHAVLCDALLAQGSSRLSPRVCQPLRQSALAFVTRKGDWSKAAGILTMACSQDEILNWCEVHGMALLNKCGVQTAERCLARISPVEISSSARILLLRSAILREREHLDEALTHAVLAQRLAEADGDLSTQSSAILYEMRLAMFSDDLTRARRGVKQLAGPLGEALCPPARCVLESYVAWLEFEAGNFAQAQEHLLEARTRLGCLEKTCEEAAWAANTLAGVYGMMIGRWSDASAQLMSAAAWPGTSPLQSLQCRGNAAFALLELGSLREAQALLAEVVQATADAKLHVLKAAALATMAEILWVSDPAESRRICEDVRRALSDWQDDLGLAMVHISQAVLCRAEGAAEEALAHAEAALSQLRAHGDSVHLLRIAAEAEVAASMLALGDRWGAMRLASRIEADLEGSPAEAHLLVVSMVLAELARLDGRRNGAVDRLADFADYIATGSANWRVAIYVRGFPGLLGVLVCALGAERLPLRMVRLIPEAVIESAFALGDGLISEADRQVLLARAWRSEHPVPVVDEVAAKPPCRVRLFGGFEVVVNGSRVEDAYWRKRKVRLLFAMLAAQRGQDMPRDVILERLWPGMDEERARRNFYVTWSAMKRALSSVRSAEPTGKYAVCTSGVCRVTSAVSSDLDDFQAALAAIRAANSAARSEAVLVAARHLLETYRGDVLPGDLYEEWFADLREQTKHDFCDAMLLGAQTAEALGDSAEALVFLRRAGGVDPWREDIYQAMMRAQIEAGQRSRAIETYMTCRGRLVDDLGIDPSAETTRLYQAVLAMESDPVEEVDRV